jgi:hypothetical protein
MKNFKQFLAERNFSPTDNDEVSDVDFYGEHTKLSPEDYGNFIKSLTDKFATIEKDFNDSPLSREDYDYLRDMQGGHQRELDYHITNPHITDEHLHHAVPHLLNHNFKSTVENLDIPWSVMKPHAEMAMVAFPDKKNIRAFNAREEIEKGKAPSVTPSQY